MQLEQYHFTNSNIDLACEEVGRFLDRCGVERREALRTKLTVEEVLLEYQANFGEDGPTFAIKCRRRLSNLKVELIIAGESFDPLNKNSDESNVIQGLLARMSLAPTWSYKNGKNYIVFTPKKKPLSDAVKMVSAIGLSIVAGVLLNLLPLEICTAVNDYFLTPVTDAFFGLITAVAGPIIFLSVLESILSMGDMETFGKIGSKTVKVILSYSAVIAVLMTVLTSLFFPVTAAGGGGGSDFQQILDMIFDIIPSNLFEPFLSGNALQLIFIAIMVGLGMLVLSTKVSGVFTLVEQLSTITQTIMSGLSCGLPFLIFVLFTGMISSGSLNAVLGSWKMAVLMILLCVLYYVANILWIAVRKRVSPFLLFKKAWPTLMIALTTASSGAAFSTNVKDARTKLGINKRLVEFGIPLGQVLFMPGTIAELLAIELCLAQSCDIAITLPWLMIALITNLLLSYACPPVAGGGAMSIAIVFSMLGLPAEMMGIALVIDSITDFPITATNVSGWQLTLINVADSLDMLDKDTLRKKQ